MNVCDRCIQIYCVNTNINNTVRPIHKKNSIPPQVDKFELISVKWLFHSFLSESYSFIQVLFTTFFCQNQATIGTTLQSFDKSCSYRDVIGRGKKGNQIRWRSAQISRMTILTSTSLGYIQQPRQTDWFQWINLRSLCTKCAYVEMFNVSQILQHWGTVHLYVSCSIIGMFTQEISINGIFRACIMTSN